MALVSPHAGGSSGRVLPARRAAMPVAAAGTGVGSTIAAAPPPPPAVAGSGGRAPAAASPHDAPEVVVDDGSAPGSAPGGGRLAAGAAGGAGSSSEGDLLDRLEAEMAAADAVDGDGGGGALPPSKDPDVVAHLRNVSKTYLLGIEGVPALRGVTCTIRRGEFVVILGKSGGGKTSLLNILGTIDRPTRGDLYLCGTRVDAKTTDAVLADLRLRRIGFVFQTFNLLPTLTALENVELPMTLAGWGTAAARRKRAIRLLTRVGLAERLHHVPSMLSGGEQQRTTIARALANRPSILLLDEPTGDLDGNNSQIVLALLTDLNRLEGVTCVMVTHDVALKAYAHRVLHMLDGKVARIEAVPAFTRTDALEALAASPPVQAMIALEERRRAEAAAQRGISAGFAAGGGSADDGDSGDEDGRAWFAPSHTAATTATADHGHGGGPATVGGGPSSHPAVTVDPDDSSYVSDATLAAVNAAGAPPSTTPAPRPVGGGMWSAVVGLLGRIGLAAAPAPTRSLPRTPSSLPFRTRDAAASPHTAAAHRNPLVAPSSTTASATAAPSRSAGTSAPAGGAAPLAFSGLSGVAAISHALFDHEQSLSLAGDGSDPARRGGGTMLTPHASLGVPESAGAAGAGSRSVVRRPQAYATVAFELQHRAEMEAQREARRRAAAEKEAAARATALAHHEARLRRAELTAAAADAAPPSAASAPGATSVAPALVVAVPPGGGLRIASVREGAEAEAADIARALAAHAESGGTSTASGSVRTAALANALLSLTGTAASAAPPPRQEAATTATTSATDPVSGEGEAVAGPGGRDAVADGSGGSGSGGGRFSSRPTGLVLRAGMGSGAAAAALPLGAVGGGSSDGEDDGDDGDTLQTAAASGRVMGGGGRGRPTPLV